MHSHTCRFSQKIATKKKQWTSTSMSKAAAKRSGFFECVSHFTSLSFEAFFGFRFSVFGFRFSFLCQRRCPRAALLLPLLLLFAALPLILLCRCCDCFAFARIRVVFFLALTQLGTHLIVGAPQLKSNSWPTGYA